MINFSIGYSGREPLVENALQAVTTPSPNLFQDFFGPCLILDLASGNYSCCCWGKWKHRCLQCHSRRRSRSHHRRQPRHQRQSWSFLQLRVLPPAIVCSILSLFFRPLRSGSNVISDCIDIWAPGTNIVSTSAFGTNTATVVMTGTSMACPHVAGIVAGMKTRMTFSNTLNYLYVRSQVQYTVPSCYPLGYAAACFLFWRVVGG